MLDTFDDPLFGILRWDDFSAWETTVTDTFFNGFGENIRPDPAHRLSAPPAPTLSSRTQFAAIQDQLGGKAEIPAGATEKERQLLAQIGALAAANPQTHAMIEAILGSIPQEALTDDAPDGMPAPPEETQGECLFKKNSFDLCIKVRNRRSAPSAAQRDAWEQFLARGTSLWHEVLDILVADYKTLHDTRFRAWRDLFGDWQLARWLPRVETTADIKKLVCLSRFWLMPATDGDDIAEIRIAMSATFDVPYVIVRNGRVARLQGINTLSGYMRIAALEHPTLGHLERLQGFSKAWLGVLGCPAFIPYRDNALTRAHIRHDHSEISSEDKVLGWDISHGNFKLSIQTPTGEFPTDAQAEAAVTFAKSHNELASPIIDAIYRHYLESIPALRNTWDGLYIDYCVPDVNGPADLTDLMRLVEITIFPETTTGIDIGLEFRCNWSPDGVGVLLRNHKILSVVDGSPKPSGAP